MFLFCFFSQELSRHSERCDTETVAAANGVGCSASNDFDVVSVCSGSTHSYFLSLDALGTEAAKCCRLAQVLDDLETDSSDSCWCSASEKSSSSSSRSSSSVDDDELYAAVFHYLFLMPNGAAYVRKTV